MRTFCKLIVQGTADGKVQAWDHRKLDHDLRTIIMDVRTKPKSMIVIVQNVDMYYCG